MKKVSIIVPIFNVSKFISACLDSLLCQTYQHLEIIGVDDGSTDDSADIFSAYMSDRRFKLIINYENQGLPSARNLGILNATGDYLYFIDSDDWISHDTIASLLNLAERSQVDIVIGGVSKFYDDGGFLEIPDNHGKVMAKELIGVDIRSAPVLFNSVTSWNKLIRLDFIRDQGLVFKQIPRRYEDMLTYKWYLSGARVSTTSKITYYYRQRISDGINNSIMQDSSIDAYSDKILSFVDILSFTQMKGLFLSEIDPLHSNYSMMNLPRALSWMIPKVFSMTEGNINSLVTFTASLQKLVSYFDKDYIYKLPDKIRPTINILANNDINDSFEQCLVLYKNKGMS